MSYKMITPDSPFSSNKYTRLNHKGTTIFLAGSIEMGKAVPWHDDVAKKIDEALDIDNLIFFNPRRKSDFTAEMEIPQIKWEQERLESCDYIFMFIDPDTKSPISLLEFGQYVSNDKLFVVCDKSFYRYNNLKLTAERNGTFIYDTVDEGIQSLILQYGDTHHNG